MDRWKVFGSNRRAWWSLIVLGAISVIAVLADVIANDRPALVVVDGKWFFPFAVDYAESDIPGGEFPTPAEWRDPWLLEELNRRGAVIVWPPIPWSYDTVDFALPDPAPTPPDSRHWLGTDDAARDVLARVIHGMRISLAFAVLLTAISASIGIAVGAAQAWYGGRVDLYGQRFVEIWSGLPVLYMLIVLQSYVVPGFWTLLAIAALFGWTALIGVVRAEVLRVRNFEFVTAARALGATDTRILIRHVIPNAMVATLTFLPFLLVAGVTTLTSLDFLGFGLPPDWPSLGELLAQGKDNPQAPWLGLTAFVTIAGLLSLLVFVGEGVRDAFDPRRTSSVRMS